MAQSQLNQGKVVTLHSAATSLPAPTVAGSGADITSLGPNPSRHAAISVDGSTAITMSDAKVYGYDPIDAKWRYIAPLNLGTDISLTAVIGYQERLVDIATFSRLCVSATLDTGNVTIKIKLIEDF